MTLLDSREAPDAPFTFDDLQMEIESTVDLSGQTESTRHLEPIETHERVVKSYLGRLEELELEVPGNPLLKATIGKHVERWENYKRPDMLLELAIQMKRTVAEVENRCQRRMEELMQLSHFFRATEVDVFLNHIIGGERRYKSQFETHCSSGWLDFEFRSDVEEQLFGFPPHDCYEGDRAKSKRPIYGYFSLNENGVLNEEGRHPPKSEVSRYGSVTVKIKREVAERRATMTLDDSLGTYYSPVCPIALPHFSALFFSCYDEDTIDSIREFLEKPISYSTFWWIYGNYTEVQYHGGLSVDDIESVHLSRDNGLSQEEIDEITVAVETYNRESGNNISIVIY